MCHQCRSKFSIIGSILWWDSLLHNWNLKIYHRKGWWHSFWMVRLASRCRFGDLSHKKHVRTSAEDTASVQLIRLMHAAYPNHLRVESISFARSRYHNMSLVFILLHRQLVALEMRWWRPKRTEWKWGLNSLSNLMNFIFPSVFHHCFGPLLQPFDNFLVK